MTHDPIKFAVVDPRSMDGNPYEVAARAVAQSRALTRLLQLSLPDTVTMALNAQMERDLTLTGEADAPSWEESAQGRAFTRIQKQLDQIATALAVLERAVGYDPRHPPTP